MLSYRYKELKQIMEEFNEIKKEYEKKYYDVIVKKLDELGMLETDVIRNMDGKRGRFVINKRNDCIDFSYEIEFHPYKKNGELAMNQSGFNFSFEELKQNFTIADPLS